MVQDFILLFFVRDRLRSIVVDFGYVLFGFIVRVVIYLLVINRSLSCYAVNRSYSGYPFSFALLFMFESFCFWCCISLFYSMLSYQSSIYIVFDDLLPNHFAPPHLEHKYTPIWPTPSLIFNFIHAYQFSSYTLHYKHSESFFQRKVTVVLTCFLVVLFFMLVVACQLRVLWGSGCVFVTRSIFFWSSGRRHDARIVSEGSSWSGFLCWFGERLLWSKIYVINGREIKMIDWRSYKGGTLVTSLGNRSCSLWNRCGLVFKARPCSRSHDGSSYLLASAIINK